MSTVLYFILFLLHMVGVLAVFSASNDGSLVLKQMIFFGVGSVMFWLIQSQKVLSSKFLQINSGKSVVAFAVALAMLLVVLIAGREVNGARRWLAIGGFALQATEFVKVLFLVYFAYLLHVTGPKYEFKKWAEMPAIVSMAMLCFLIYLEPDYGTIALLSCVFGGMLLVSGLPKRKVLLYLVAAAMLGVATIGGASYRSQRIEAYKDPWKFRYDAGYQTTSSFEALGTGHWFGVGFREGTHKKHRLPEAHNDYIMAVIGEEFGFFGVTVVLSLYLGLFGLVFHRAFTVLRDWKRLYAVGLLLMSAGAVSMNLYVVTGLVPSKGIAMPMISAGGSSLLAFVLMYGLFARWVTDTLRESSAKGDVYA